MVDETVTNEEHVEPVAFTAQAAEPDIDEDDEDEDCE